MENNTMPIETEGPSVDEQIKTIAEKFHIPIKWELKNEAERADRQKALDKEIDQLSTNDIGRVRAKFQSEGQEIVEQIQQLNEEDKDFADKDDDNYDNYSDMFAYLNGVMIFLNSYRVSKDKKSFLDRLAKEELMTFHNALRGIKKIGQHKGISLEEEKIVSAIKTLRSTVSYISETEFHDDYDRQILAKSPAEKAKIARIKKRLDELKLVS